MSSTKKLVVSALMLSMALVLPFFTGQIPEIGNMLLPMHLPVLLAGFIVGGPSAMMVGAIAPILRSIIWGMPPMFPKAIGMAFELAAYGFVSGIIYSKSKKDTTIVKQLLRSATSVGANINEAIYGNSKADFISKLHISLKETGESIYWLTLLKRTNLIVYDFDKLLSLAEEIKRMLIASLNTAKSSAENK